MFPAALHLDLLRQARGAAQPLGLEPAGDGRGALAQRGLLQGLQRGELPAQVMVRALQCRRFLLAQVDARTDLADTLPGGHEQRLPGSGQFLLLGRDLDQAVNLVGRRIAIQVQLFLPHALQPLVELLHVALQVIQPGALDLHRLGALCRAPVELIPGLAPLVHGLLGGLQHGAGLLGALGRGLQLRLDGTDVLHQLLQAAGVALDVLADLPQCLFRARQFLLLLLARFLAVLDRLLDAGHVGAEPVVVALHLVETLVGPGQRLPQLLQFGLDAALCRQLRLHGGLEFADLFFALAAVPVQAAVAQRQQFRPDLALLFLEFLVALGRARLALELAELLVDFLEQVVQPVEVLAGVLDAVFGLAAAFLVLGDAGGLLQEHPQLLRLGLDQARDHALLDDGVATRPEAGAEEDVGDVAAPAPGAVQEIGGGAVARDLAADGDLVVAGVLAGDLAFGVVEGQLDAGVADRLARRRAVEDDVRHGIAAQVLGGGLAHDPAHGVDDVRLAAAVGADDADQFAGDVDRGRVHEGLEPCQLDLGEPHGRLMYSKCRPSYNYIVEAGPLAHSILCRVS